MNHTMNNNPAAFTRIMLCNLLPGKTCRCAVHSEYDKLDRGGIEKQFEYGVPQLPAIPARREVSYIKNIKSRIQSSQALSRVLLFSVDSLYLLYLKILLVSYCNIKHQIGEL